MFLTRLCLLVLAAPIMAIAGEELARHTVDSNGVKISCVVEGKGEPVVLIHGLYSSIKMNWEMPGTLAMLAKDHQVVGIDMPGHGQSDKPEKDEAYGMAMVEDVIAVMDELKIKKAHIVGYSMGGMIALKLISKHPDRVISGTLGGMGMMKEGGFLQKVWEEMMGKREGGAVPPACTRGFGKFAMTDDEVKSIKTPLCVLVGDRDPCRKMYVEPLHRLRDDIPILEIKDAGHMNCIAKQEFKDELQKWIDKNAEK